VVVAAEGQQQEAEEADAQLKFAIGGTPWFVAADFALENSNSLGNKA
jgi:hypothetical protein